MEIETPGCTTVVLPHQRKQNKAGHRFVIRELEFKAHRHGEMCKYVHGKKGKEKRVCWHGGGVSGAQRKFGNWMKVLMFV